MVDHENFNKVREQFAIGSLWHCVSAPNSIVQVTEEILSNLYVRVKFLQPRDRVGEIVYTPTHNLNKHLPPVVEGRSRSRSRSRGGCRDGNRDRGRYGTRKTRRRNRSRSRRLLK
jgi:hypothetical protein